MSLLESVKSAAAKVNFPIYLEVRIGKDASSLKPAPVRLMKQLIQAEVQQTDRAPSGFQLVFDSSMGILDTDYPLIDEPLLEDFNRVTLVVYLLFKKTVLIDGFITRRELDPASGSLTVTGEDASAKMDLVELQAEYPEMTDSSIVQEILGAYADLKITADVTAPDGEQADTQQTPTQRCTDRVFLVRLAQQNGFLFYMLPPDQPGGESTAYWGPKVLEGKRQHPLSAGSGTLKGNVESLSGSYSALAPTLSYGEKMVAGEGGDEKKEVAFGTDTATEKALAKLATPLSEFTELIAEPSKARDKIVKLKVRGKFIKDAGLDSESADKAADKQTNRDTGDAVKLTGSLDTVNYGAVLRAPGLVGVRAAGDSFSGDYYVKTVKHSFKFRRSEMRYTQSFTLTREALGAKGTSVKVNTSVGS